MANLNSKFQKVAHIRLDVESMIAACKTEEEKKALYNKLAWHIGLLKSTTTTEGKFLADGITKAECLQELYDILIAESPEHAAAHDIETLKKILDLPKEQLAEMTVVVDLDGVELPKKFNMTAKNVKVNEVAVGDQNFSTFVGTENVIISNVEISGDLKNSKQGGSNARIIAKANEDVHISGIDFTKATGGYNCIEVNLSNMTPASNVLIEDCVLANMTNNGIIVFGCTEGGTITIKNCKFILNDGAEAVRISNTTSAEHFTVNVENCDYKYVSDEHSEGNAKYLGFFLFQDYNKTVTLEKPFAGLTVNVKNVTCDGKPCTENIIGTADETQFSCMYYDVAIGERDKGDIVDPTHFPTFNFA